MRCCKIDRSKLVVVSLVVLLLSSVFIFGSAAAQSDNLFSRFGSFLSSIGAAAKSITGWQVSDSGTGSDKMSGVPGSATLGGGGTGEIACGDSDGGLNYDVKGTVTYTGTTGYAPDTAGGNTYTDKCGGTAVNEFYCENVELKTVSASCKYGCKEGACIKEPGCVSDNECLSETTKYCDGANACTSATNYKCDNGECVEASPGTGECTICPNGCKDGACVKELSGRTPPCGSYGDVDLNGYVNDDDVTFLSDYLSGKVQLSAEQKKLADVNNDGAITVSDSLAIINYVKFGGTFPVCSAEAKCTDSDGGKNYYVKGTAVDKNGKSYTDFCGQDGIYEYYCDENNLGYVSTNWIKCQYGCKDGACLVTTPTAEPKIYTTKSEYVLNEMIEVYTKLPQNMDCDQYAASSDGREFQLGSAGCFADGVSFSVNSIRLGVGKWQIKIVAKYSTTTTVASANTAESIVLLSPPFVINAVAVPVEECPVRIELFTDKDAYNVGERGKLTVKTYNSKGKLQGYDLLGKIEPTLITTPVVQKTSTTEVSYSSFSTKPSGVYESESVVSSSSGINGEPGMYTITVRQQWGCDGSSNNIVSAAKNIEILPLGTGPGVPIDRVYNVKIAKGWNLVSLLPMIAIGERVGSSSSTCSFISGDDGLAEYAKNNIFGYDSINRKYIKLGDLIGAAGNIPNFERDGYIVNTQINGYWLRSSEDCSMTADWSSVSEEDTMFNIIRKISSSGYKLAQGWNFFSILPEMEGKTLDDVKGSCQVQRAYGYDAAGRKWVAISDSAAHHNDVGYGLIMKVADDCVLGSGAGSPPPLPEESAAVKAAKLTTRAVSTTSAAN